MDGWVWMCVGLCACTCVFVCVYVGVGAFVCMSMDVFMRVCGCV